MATNQDRPRALLLWTGGLFRGSSNFGVPQLLAIAGAMRATTDIHVDVVDLDIERAFGPIVISDLLARDTGGAGYDIVGIACYSSYDYLKVIELGRRIRAILPNAWIVTGGYHASARPNDMVGDLPHGGQSPFDFVVIGEGEGPMSRLASALVAGKKPPSQVLGPDPVADPRAMPPLDWERLARYKPVARTVASQAEISLSRGCPFDCAFCMERAKRITSWRALDPLQAVEEMHRLDSFIDLSSWTLFISDALFGLKTAWRRQFLESLAARPVRARKVWLLVRLDLLEREDVVLMQRANVAPGFGLESGDPDQLLRIRKVGPRSDYLGHMMSLARWASDLGVPWGANVIVGHPGETESSLRNTVQYLERLFGNPNGTTGFLSVDPFRLYPSSAIEENRATWEATTGLRIHRYPWWFDGDQDFLSAWVDPSSDLDFRRCHTLRYKLFRPILDGIQRNFAYNGPARDYFMRAIREQIQAIQPENEARTLGLDRLWRTLIADEPNAVPEIPLALDTAFASASREARKRALARRGLDINNDIGRAVCDVPRERFVPIESLPEAHRDRALPLDDTGHATISAMHAYAATFQALGLTRGDSLVDLGGGSGYGAAIAANVVGESGSVTTIEIDPALAARARNELAGTANVRVIAGDAHDTSLWHDATKVSVGFDVCAVPPAWIDALALGGRLVAPVSGELVVVDKSNTGTVTHRSIGKVVYVRDRSQRSQIESLDPPGSSVSETITSRA